MVLIQSVDILLDQTRTHTEQGHFRFRAKLVSLDSRVVGYEGLENVQGTRNSFSLGDYYY